MFKTFLHYFVFAKLATSSTRVDIWNSVFRLTSLFCQVPAMSWPVLGGGGNQSSRRKTPPNPSHWCLSHMPWPWFEPGQWDLTATIQWKRLRPFGYSTGQSLSLNLYWYTAWKVDLLKTESFLIWAYICLPGFWNFVFRHFFCHVAANSWLTSCNWWRKPAYPVKTTA